MRNEPIEAESTENSCRLCAGALVRAFCLKVLRKYDVAYLKCTNCDSLQTERPYWIQEAYTSNLSMLDTGAGQRNLSNLAATYTVSRVLRMNDVIDFGGGDGLLCRLLRDYGVNCFVNDKYASATYARGFETPDFSQPEILLAFEVLEHFENPNEDFKAIFQPNPAVILASTAIFVDQGADWWYLAPETGQHLFLYSEKALHLVANSYAYELIICSGHIVFLRKGVANRANKSLIRLALRRPLLRVLSAGMRLMPTKGVWKDFNFLRSGKN